MSFYDINVTKPIIKSNGITSLSSGGAPVPVRITIGGVLDKLGLITQGTAAYTGTVARDVYGGWNIYSNISVLPNQQVPLVSVSGAGLAHWNMLKDGLERSATSVWDYKPGTVSATPNYPDTSYINSSGLVATPSASQSDLWTLPLVVPICQQMFNGIVGYWELGNPLAQLSLQLTPAYTGSASPYGIASSTAGALPYFAASVPGTNNATLASPQVDVIRYLYDTPVDPANRPPTTFINTLLEDTPQNNVGSATSLNYAFAPLSGYVARVLAVVLDSTTGVGVSPDLMLQSGAVTFGIGDGTTLISESIYENLLRQRTEMHGTDMPQGSFFFDFLGPDLTWQNVFSTYDNANVNMSLNFSSALGASSTCKIIRQVLKPLQYTAR